MLCSFRIQQHNFKFLTSYTTINILFFNSSSTSKLDLTEEKNSTSSEDYDIDNDETESFKENTKRPVVATGSCTSTPKPKSLRPKRAPKAIDEVDAKLLQILPSPQPSSSPKDDVEQFLLSLDPTLRRLKPRHQTRAKINLLNELEESEAFEEKEIEKADEKKKKLDTSMYQLQPLTQVQQTCTETPQNHNNLYDYTQFTV